jgi:hypothetical protein
MKRTMCILACMLMATLAKADTRYTSTVQALLEACKSTSGPNMPYCLGFIVGVSEMMQQVSAGLEGGGDFRAIYGMCPKGHDGPSGGAKVQVFINWAEKNPKMWGKDNLIGVITALREAWPCEASN